MSERREAGRGVRSGQRRGTGDLYLNVAVRIPERVSDADRRLWARLRPEHHGDRE